MSEIFQRKDFSQLLENAGLFCLFDENNKSLFVGAAKKLKHEIHRTSEDLAERAASVEIWQTEENLPREFASLIRRKQPRLNLSIHELYSHLKITREKFPRLLVTRRILNETDEYFGAFLNRTGVRIWLYVLSQLFRLRSCELDIRGGDLPAPCMMFREKRCLAPCVDRGLEEYAEMVDLLRLFLTRKESELEQFLKAKIESSAEILDFEKAGEWRDLLNAIQNVFADPKMNLWLDDAVDTYFLEKDPEKLLVHVITTRGKRTLGFQTFVFSNKNSDSFVLSEVLWQFYQFHAPKEIRVTRDFKGRKFFAESLSRQAKRDVKVSIISDEKYKTAFRSLKRAKRDLELKRLSNLKTVEEIEEDLQDIFSLPQKPKRIEAFDVAHIANEDFVAACAVWEDGKLRAEDFRFWLLDSMSEPQAMAEAVARRMSEAAEKPDLILLDGGRNQMKAVREILANEDLNIIAAVKPNKKRGEISHFLTAGGKRIDFERRTAFEVLRGLRDEAHALANEIHRQRREIRLFSNETGEKTLVVPIRFDEPNGAAENFRLISTVKF